MPPRSTTLPSAQTESARELARRFFCELCGKGYARINEYEAHENSYDHQHRKRLKEMRALTRNPTAAVRDNRETKKRRENAEMLSGNLQASDGARPTNASGFRDAMASKSGGGGSGVEGGRGFQGEVRGVERGRREEVVEEEEVKVVRPPMWDELDRFYELVDAGVLPTTMLHKGADLPWGGIWKDRGDMDTFIQAVDVEIDGLEDGRARQELKRSRDALSDADDSD